MVILPLQSIFPALNDLIRQVELNDENSLLSSQTRVAGNQQTVSDPNNPLSQNGSSNQQSPINVSGTDSSQVAQLNVTSAGNYGADVIQGQVLNAASAATLTVVGAAGAVAASSGHYELAGNLGSTDLYLAAGESLYSAAFGISQESAQTGVSASVDGNNLVLTSNQVGSNALVSLQPYGSSPQIVQGVNSHQINSFSVLSQTPGTTDSISGTVTSSAEGAQLVYQGALGATVASAASFRLTGSRGSTDVTLTAGQSLSSVANGVNQQTASTGVIATVSGNDLLLTSDTTGAGATVKIDSVTTETGTSTSGINSSQVAGLNVSSLNSGAHEVLSGNVLHAASGAQITLQGSATSTVINSATFNLTGSSGSAQISIQQGESLANVASQVNALTSNTGVVAQVDGDQVVFQSVGVGSASQINVQLTNISHSTDVTGVNAQQLSGFTVNSLTTGASDTLNGTIDQTAAQASLTLQGTNQGTVAASATFELTGAIGSTNVSVTQGQSLSSVAAQVNSLTSSTGVVANLVGNNIVFQSTGVGSAANVGVNLTNISHTNVVSGVNSQQLSGFTVNSLTPGATDALNGTVNQTATQASVTLQGTAQATVAATATFQVSGALGSTNITVTQGESLSSVAAQVNALTSSTGVVANVSGNNLLFQSSGVGSASNVAVNLIDVSHSNVVSGVNSQQLSGFAVNNFTSGASETFNGQVTRAASQAQVSLQGSSSGTVVSSNTFNVTGSAGTAQVSITAGESLSAVAAQVNALTGTTGVVAAVSGNQVNLNSVGVGSSQSVALTLANVNQATTVTDVNPQQLTSFNVNSFAVGGSETFSGTVTKAGTSAQLTFTGSNGTVNTNSTFTLTGSQGSAVFTTTTSESLSSLAAQVNASATGVQAVVSGNTLIFQSTGVGSAAAVGVNATTGTFSVSGGNGNGTANGTNAVATINGQTITGTGNSFNFSDALGNYSFTTASGFTGAIDPIGLTQVNQATGSTYTTTVSGVNSLQLTNVQANTFAAGDSTTLSGTVTQSATAAQLSYASTLGLINNSSTFTLTGSLGSAVFSTTGLESISTLAAQVNAATSTTGVQAIVSGSNLNFVSTGVGSSASVAVKVTNGNFSVTGGFGNGTASGTNAQATINGQTLTGNGNAFQFSDAKGAYSFNTVAGFTGAINTVTVGQVTQAVNSAYTTSITGVNAGQVTNFLANSFATGASNSLSGTITKAATSAQLTFTGNSGKVNTNSTFTLTGSLGSTSITTTNNETLTSLASQINSSTSTTGVQAVVSGNTLTLQSTGIGSAASVAVTSTSGNFSVTGGFGNGTASGTDALAVINGQSLTGNGNSFQFSDAVGNYSLTAASGYTGAISSININSTVGQFNVTGGNGNGTGNGADAQATVNGQTLTGNGNSFQFSDSLGSYSFQTTQGFTGTLNPVSVVSQAGQFNLTGNNAAASQTPLTLAGSSSGTVTSTATFNLVGALGTAQISVQQGQTLASVAAQVNALTSSTGVSAQVSSNQLIFNNTVSGSSTPVGVQLTSVNGTNVVTGVNTQQLIGFSVNNFTAGASETFNGQVTRAASQAQLSLQGSSSGTVVSSNTFNVTGSTGTAQISITAGEALSAVAAQINALTSTTGVVAQVSGNQVNVSSVGVGSSQGVSLTLANVKSSTTVTDVNSQQLTSFNVNSFTTGGSETLSGTVAKAGTSAKLTFAGSNGTVNSNSTFTLTGSHGSAVFTTTTSETLSSLASQVNAATSTTGVEAVVSGNTLIFQSNGVGSNAAVGINATTGTFSVSGGNGNGAANGTNAVATINGQTITGTGNSFNFSDALGNYSFTTASGFTGAIDPIGLTQVNQATGSTYTTTVSGVNSQQLTNVQANTFAAGDSTTLSGSITQSATNAQLTFAGNTNGTVNQNSTFTLSGSLGSATFTTTSSETLATLAAQVNAATSTTGVQAVVSGNNVNFVSTGVGSSASVAVKVSNGNFNVTGGFGNGTASGTNAQATINGHALTGNGNAFDFSDAKGTYSFNTAAGFTGAINAVTVGQITQATNAAYTTSITGVNAAQVSNFQANAIANGASNSLSGTITKSATSAQLTFTGNTNGTVNTNSTFTLSGSQGSATFTTTNNETLSSLASQINAATSTTGVQATVSGNLLTLQSTGVGSAASVGVAATLGNFTVSGGFGNGTASGTDAQAVINGQALTGNGNTFHFSDAVGNYSLTAASGYTGAISTINVGSTVGQFNVTGGNGNGSANGVDAQATVNGQTLTANGNSFQFSDSLGSYSFQTAAGFTGTINPVSVSSQTGLFSLSGSNGLGSAHGSDAVATINGQTVTGNGNAFQYSDGVGSYSFNTVAGFTGALNTISIDSQAGQFNLTGGNGNGTASGTNAVATINGQTVTGNGNAFQYSDAVGSYSFSAVPGYVGVLNAINILSQAGQFTLTGGNGAGSSTGTDAQADINGQNLTGTGNLFSISDANGAYQLQFVNGFQGAFNPITVQSNSGNFQIAGGDGHGTSTGSDFAATINGVQYTGTTNNVTVAGNHGTYAINFANGFVGNFDPITVTSGSANSGNAVLGGVGGTAFGTDAVAEINGIVQTGKGSTFNINQNGTQATIEFVKGFTGTFNPITIAQSASGSNGTEVSDSTTTTPQSSAASNSNSLTAAENLRLIQIQVNNQLLQNEFDALYSEAAPVSALNAFNSAQWANSNSQTNPSQSTDSPSQTQSQISPSQQFFNAATPASSRPANQVNYQA